jgi:hypothetical protein
MLLPIGLTTDLYYALKSGSKDKENIFYSWRQRYNVAANDKSSRPRIRRRSHMKLRAAFGLLIEWFRVCVRHGWVRIPEHTRKNSEQHYARSGRTWLRRVIGSRRRRGVAIPYGRYAERAGTLGLLCFALPGNDPPGPEPPGSDPVDLASPNDDALPF